jgi:hypothetical protein
MKFAQKHNNLIKQYQQIFRDKEMSVDILQNYKFQDEDTYCELANLFTKMTKGSPSPIEYKQLSLARSKDFYDNLSPSINEYIMNTRVPIFEKAQEFSKLRYSYTSPYTDKTDEIELQVLSDFQLKSIIRQTRKEKYSKVDGHRYSSSEMTDNILLNVLHSKRLNSGQFIEQRHDIFLELKDTILKDSKFEKNNTKPLSLLMKSTIVELSYLQAIEVLQKENKNNPNFQITSEMIANFSKSYVKSLSLFMIENNDRFENKSMNNILIQKEIMIQLAKISGHSFPLKLSENMILDSSSIIKNNTKTTFTILKFPAISDLKDCPYDRDLHFLGNTPKMISSNLEVLNNSIGMDHLSVHRHGDAFEIKKRDNNIYYKTSKNNTWSEISELYNIPVDVLKESNKKHLDKETDIIKEKIKLTIPRVSINTKTLEIASDNNVANKYVSVSSEFFSKIDSIKSLKEKEEQEEKSNEKVLTD